MEIKVSDHRRPEWIVRLPARLLRPDSFTIRRKKSIKIRSGSRKKTGLDDAAAA
jgi:hypothetical protein